MKNNDVENKTLDSLFKNYGETDDPKEFSWDEDDCPIGKEIW